MKQSHRTMWGERGYRASLGQSNSYGWCLVQLSLFNLLKNYKINNNSILNKQIMFDLICG